MVGFSFFVFVFVLLWWEGRGGSSRKTKKRRILENGERGGGRGDEEHDGDNKYININTKYMKTKKRTNKQTNDDCTAVERTNKMHSEK